MSIGSDYTLTGPQIDDIFTNRLAPYLPSTLLKVEPDTYRVRYTFKPFTGREPKPEQPPHAYKDPKLAYRNMDEEAGRPVGDEAEYDLREAALFLLDTVYQQAVNEWRNAAHIADLKATVKDAADLWKAHERAKNSVAAAFAYLREPDAAKEWPSAVSRLVDAHTEIRKAAAVFDARALKIAEAHDKHSHEEGYGDLEALKLAGYPEAKDWWLLSADDYGTDYRGEFSNWSRCLEAQATRLITEQEEHVAKVGRLTGTSA